MACDASDGFDACALGAGLGELEALQAALAERGVFGVPTCLVARQLFIGRAHLPMIRRLLGPDESRQT